MFQIIPRPDLNKMNGTSYFVVAAQFVEENLVLSCSVCRRKPGAYILKLSEENNE